MSHPQNCKDSILDILYQKHFRRQLLQQVILTSINYQAPLLSGSLLKRVTKTCHKTITNFLAKIRDAYIFYDLKNNHYSQSPHCKKLHIPAFTELDVAVGKFARCYTTKFLPWLTFNYDSSVSDILTSIASACDLRVICSPLFEQDSFFIIAKEFAMDLLLTRLQEDDFALDRLKRILLTIVTAMFCLQLLYKNPPLSQNK